MRILAWIFRALALLLLARLGMRLLFGRRAGPQGQPGGGPAGPQAGKSGGELVRDPHCGTYVAKARAIAATAGHETLYFCSATCRDAHRAAKAGPA